MDFREIKKWIMKWTEISLSSNIFIPFKIRVFFKFINQFQHVGQAVSISYQLSTYQNPTQKSATFRIPILQLLPKQYL